MAGTITPTGSVVWSSGSPANWQIGVSFETVSSTSEYWQFKVKLWYKSVSGSFCDAWSDSISVVTVPDSGSGTTLLSVSHAGDYWVTGYGTDSPSCIYESDVLQLDRTSSIQYLKVTGTGTNTWTQDSGYQGTHSAEATDYINALDTERTCSFYRNRSSSDSTVLSKSTVSSGSAYTFPSDPTWTGHTFEGWYTKRNGGTEKTSLTAGSSNTALYAHWEANEYTVTFNSNGGSTPSPSSKTVAYGSTYGTLPSVTRSGYSFVGWYTAETGGNKRTASSKVSITANQTLYAHWTIPFTATKLSKMPTVYRCDSTGARSDEGNYFHVGAKYSVDSSIAASGITVTVQYKRKSDSAWSDAAMTVSSKTTTAFAGYTSSEVLSNEYAYNVKVTVSVANPNGGTSAASKSTFITETYFVIDIDSDGKGIGFGIVAPTDGATFNQTLRVRDANLPSASTYEASSNYLQLTDSTNTVRGGVKHRQDSSSNVIPRLFGTDSSAAEIGVVGQGTDGNLWLGGSASNEKQIPVSSGTIISSGWNATSEMAGTLEAAIATSASSAMIYDILHGGNLPKFIQMGTVTVTTEEVSGTSHASGSVNVSFPTTFDNVPYVVTQIKYYNGAIFAYASTQNTETTSGATIYVYSDPDTAGDYTVLWMAIDVNALGGGPAPGYRQVEYLQSTGSQYLAGFDSLNDHRYYDYEAQKWVYKNVFEMKLSVPTTGAGSYAGGSTPTAYWSTVGGFEFPSIVDGGSSLSVTVGKSWSWSTVDTITFANDGDPHVLKFDMNEHLIYFDGTSQSINWNNSWSYVGNGSCEHIALFNALNNFNNPVYRGYSNGVRIYSFSWKNDGVYVHNLIPCVRRSDSKPGMYDTVTGTFFTNLGSGEFIVP